MYICTDALREGKQFDKCLDNLEKMMSVLQKPENATKRDYFAVYYYIKGGCLRGLQKYDEAEEALKQSIAENGKIIRETWIVPMSWVVLGEMAMEQKQWTSASAHFDKVKNFKDYDWENLAAFRVYGNRQTLSKLLKPK